MYALAIEEGANFAVHEIRTKVFPMYFDIDAWQAKAFSTEQLMEILMTITTVCATLYPDLPDDAMWFAVSGREPNKKPTADGTPWIKSGCHIIMKYLLVDAPIAYTIYAKTLAALEKAHSRDFHTHNTWRQVLDAAVYRETGGLRMVLSQKIVKCSTCKNSKKKDGRRVPCEICQGQNAFDGNPYQIMGIYTSVDGVIELHERSTGTAIKTPANAVCWSSLRREPNATVTPGFDNEQLIPFRDTTTREFKYQREIKSSGLNNCIEKVIRGMHTKYQDVYVNHVRVISKTKCRIVLHQGHNSSFCQNKGSTHSNNIFFEISMGKKPNITQRCFCTCDVERKDGICKNYRSPPIPIELELANQIFTPGAAMILDKPQLVCDDGLSGLSTTILGQLMHLAKLRVKIQAKRMMVLSTNNHKEQTGPPRKKQRQSYAKKKYV